MIWLYSRAAAWVKALHEGQDPAVIFDQATLEGLPWPARRASAEKTPRYQCKASGDRRVRLRLGRRQQVRQHPSGPANP